MKVNVHVDAGICGFQTDIFAESDDDQHVVFQVNSGCAKTTELGQRLAEAGPVDAYGEIDASTVGPFVRLLRDRLQGCCRGCPVQVGLFKAMQTAAGIALPKDIRITMRKE